MVHHKVTTPTGILGKTGLVIPFHLAECSQGGSVYTNTYFCSWWQSVDHLSWAGGLRNCWKNLWTRCKEHSLYLGHRATGMEYKGLDRGPRIRSQVSDYPEIDNLCLHIYWLLLSIWSWYMFRLSPNWKIKSMKASKNQLQCLMMWKRVWKQKVSSCIIVLSDFLCIMKSQSLRKKEKEAPKSQPSYWGIHTRH